jgi:hypothetical protein
LDAASVRARDANAGVAFLAVAFQKTVVQTMPPPVVGDLKPMVFVGADVSRKNVHLTGWRKDRFVMYKMMMVSSFYSFFFLFMFEAYNLFVYPYSGYVGLHAQRRFHRRFPD